MIGQAADVGQWRVMNHPSPATVGSYGTAAGPARRRTRLWLLLGAVAVLVGGGVVAVILVATGSGRSTGPGDVVSGYFAALAEGDATAALRAGPPPASTTFLTDDILAQQQAKARLGHVRITEVHQQGDAANVHVAYTFGSQHEDDDAFTLHQVDGRWLMRTTVVEIDRSWLHAVQKPTMFGRALPSEPIDVFPGPLVFGTASPQLALTYDNPDAFATSPNDTDAPSLSVVLTPAATRQTIGAVAAKLAACSRSKDLEPTGGCPQQTSAYGAYPGTATWKMKPTNLADALTLVLNGNVQVVVTGDVYFTVTYKQKDIDGHVGYTHDNVDAFVAGSVDLTKTPPIFQQVRR